MKRGVSSRQLILAVETASLRRQSQSGFSSSVAVRLRKGNKVLPRLQTYPFVNDANAQKKRAGGWMVSREGGAFSFEGVGDGSLVQGEGEELNHQMKMDEDCSHFVRLCRSVERGGAVVNSDLMKRLFRSLRQLISPSPPSSSSPSSSSPSRCVRLDRAEIDSERRPSYSPSRGDNRSRLQCLSPSEMAGAIFHFSKALRGCSVLQETVRTRAPKRKDVDLLLNAPLLHSGLGMLEEFPEREMAMYALAVSYTHTAGAASETQTLSRLQSVVEAAKPSLDRWDPRRLANLAWSLAAAFSGPGTVPERESVPALGARERKEWFGGREKLMGSVMQVVAAASDSETGHFGKMDLQSVVTLCWAVSRCVSLSREPPPREWFDRAAEEILKKLEGGEGISLSPLGAATLAASFARVHVPKEGQSRYAKVTEALVNEVVDRPVTSLDNSAFRNLVAGAGGCGGLKSKGAEWAAREAVSRLRSPRPPTSQECLDLCWAFSKRETGVVSEKALVFSSVVEAVESGRVNLTVRQGARLLTSVVRVAVRLRGRRGGVGEMQSSSDCVGAFDRLLRLFLERVEMGVFVVGDLSNSELFHLCSSLSLMQAKVGFSVERQKVGADVGKLFLVLQEESRNPQRGALQTWERKRIDETADSVCQLVCQ
uniref:RAP domain-containing protein n=1 Tax=Chromera velia CCMP2878 TaxID=1169474 RepID=A0A0G4FLQ6_9ALVE|eukprot:Cvel_17575.t1-p1 / transcript=Cvel_17575.t1 / gene=Cvel_17575 / organism=Chromera_velia_CCMP2878 / gene_product=hypothetical protein / transcript_product=hypothetical protein / location=Cvel_scaffold1412:13460-15418(+) / protein_length=653 / sequence_SO=supercontig / SO=protein_coding / is_pseudo=false